MLPLPFRFPQTPDEWYRLFFAFPLAPAHKAFYDGNQSGGNKDGGQTHGVGNLLERRPLEVGFSALDFRKVRLRQADQRPKFRLRQATGGSRLLQILPNLLKHLRLLEKLL
jgi:hypothetical protein